jgi:hypothetical protein
MRPLTSRHDQTSRKGSLSPGPPVRPVLDVAPGARSPTVCATSAPADDSSTYWRCTAVPDPSLRNSMLGKSRCDSSSTADTTGPLRPPSSPATRAFAPWGGICCGPSIVMDGDKPAPRRQPRVTTATAQPSSRLSSMVRVEGLCRDVRRLRVGPQRERAELFGTEPVRRAALTEDPPPLRSTA